MTRMVLGVAVATVVVYLWGFVFWGASSLPYTVWNETADDRAAGQALLEHFPESGVYFLPANSNPPELRSQLYDAGPTGFVIIDVDGRPEFDMTIMASGVALNAAVMTLFALLLAMCRAATPTYGDRLKLVVVVAALAVFMVNIGDGVWWASPWGWELVRLSYNFTALVLGGAIVARFIAATGDAA